VVHVDDEALLWILIVVPVVEVRREGLNDYGAGCHRSRSRLPSSGRIRPAVVFLCVAYRRRRD
jgi:hypothetical protein